MIALFAGSFHPPTNGHLDVIRRAACMFERVVVAVMVNPEKKYLLSAEERCEMLRRAAAGLDNVEVVWGTGLTAELAKKLGAGVLVRGVRNVTDMEYELQAADVNRMLTGIDTIFLPFHFPGEQSANRLTAAATDPLSGMPEFKTSAVTVRVLEKAGTP